MSRSTSQRDNDRAKSTVLDLIQESLAEKGETYRRLVADKAIPLMQSAPLKAPTTWKDAEVADRMIRKALGLESGDTQVNVAVVPGAWGQTVIETPSFGASSGPTMDVETDDAPSLPFEREE